MTTTLRPEGPEEAGADGGRTRRWRIMVNGRPVGGLRTSATPARGGTRVGSIAELEVREGHRRGRATVGALAAEEVLRSWGCGRIDVTVPADAEPALRLARALGYTETMRNLAKRLDDQPPPLPTELTHRPIGPAEYPAWRDASVAAYRERLTAAGATPAEAAERAAHDHHRALPAGPATPDTALRHLLDPDGRVLGSLWVALRQDVLPDGRLLAWVMLVEVAPEHRGRGHGRTLMHLAEHACRAAGVRDLGLNVFSDNTPALALYDSLGYRPTRRVLAKPLL
ncbi:GNAT family N-acetyltransferase [Kitasatospora sp. NPDC088391]|uniref:GNAT family N-acetyltransferase n=1 Tax=Kitasatospora sp. NPDC088391 TaxID=3364074 RepID=UPI003810B12F